ncbi:uncharacterized protein LOC128818248 [Vidua macroura]|uniref:uncharacterized protein LOC128818248 n=1 Tax=Vidua macroura TaxID=187451 RepID=UPI0023A8E1FB|nr:uncharacterized protein LOC128818248 [Vidua macroura]
MREFGGRNGDLGLDPGIWGWIRGSGVDPGIWGGSRDLGLDPGIWGWVFGKQKRQEKAAGNGWGRGQPGKALEVWEGGRSRAAGVDPGRIPGFWGTGNALTWAGRGRRSVSAWAAGRESPIPAGSAVPGIPGSSRGSPGSRGWARNSRIPAGSAGPGPEPLPAERGMPGFGNHRRSSSPSSSSSSFSSSCFSCFSCFSFSCFSSSRFFCFSCFSFSFFLLFSPTSSSFFLLFLLFLFFLLLLLLIFLLFLFLLFPLFLLFLPGIPSPRNLGFLPSTPARNSREKWIFPQKIPFKTPKIQPGAETPRDLKRPMHGFHIFPKKSLSLGPKIPFLFPKFPFNWP